MLLWAIPIAWLLLFSSVDITGPYHNLRNQGYLSWELGMDLILSKSWKPNWNLQLVMYIPIWLNFQMESSSIHFITVSVLYIMLANHIATSGAWSLNSHKRCMICIRWSIRCKLYFPAPRSRLLTVSAETYKKRIQHNISISLNSLLVLVKYFPNCM